VKLAFPCSSAEDRPSDARRSAAPMRCISHIVHSGETIRDLDSDKYVKPREQYILSAHAAARRHVVELKVRKYVLHRKEVVDLIPAFEKMAPHTHE
jgi:hypothetical protein